MQLYSITQWRDGLLISALDQRPRGRGFESAGCRLSRSNHGPVALCTLGLGLLNPPSSRGREMSTGYSWEDIRQVRATLLGARHVPERLCGGRVYLGRYIKCSTFYLYSGIYVAQINHIIMEGITVPDAENDLRKQQLRELALLNGTLRENDALL